MAIIKSIGPIAKKGKNRIEDSIREQSVEIKFTIFPLELLSKPCKLSLNIFFFK